MARVPRTPPLRTPYGGMTVAEPAQPDHVGFAYRSVAEYVAGTLGFVHAALEAGQPVLVAVPSAKLEILRDCLGDDARRVGFTDLTVEGRNPGRIIPGVMLAFVDGHPGRRVAIVAEPVWPDRDALEYPACVAHEAVLNLAFAGRDAALLCPYDAALLDPHMVRDAYQTHPFMQHDSGRRASPAFVDPRATAAAVNQPLPPVPPHAATMRYDAPPDLHALRAFVTGHATTAGLKPERRDALATVVTELATNTLDHARGPGAVSVWPEHDLVVCQVHDAGHLTDPLVGRVPRASRRDGNGLMIANMFCDLVRVHTRPGATTIRLHMAAQA